MFDIQCIFRIAYNFFKKSWDKIWKERVAGSTFATANGGRRFFRALPEKIPRGICTGASFLLTLQSLPFFFGSGLGTLTSCDETNRIARNAGKPLFGLPLVDSAGNGSGAPPFPYREGARSGGSRTEKNGKTYTNNGEFDPGSG